VFLNSISVFEILGRKRIGVMRLTSRGHVKSSVIPLGHLLFAFSDSFPVSHNT